MSVTIGTDADHIEYLRYELSRVSRELEEAKSHEVKLRNEIENIITHLEVYNARVGVTVNPHLDVLHSLQDRDQWREMAERLAISLRGLIRKQRGCQCDKCGAARSVLAAFDKLEGGGK